MADEHRDAVISGRKADDVDSPDPSEVLKHAVIELAWSDAASFEGIASAYGLSEAEVIALMRRHLKPSSFRLWRARVSGRASKHARRNRSTSFDSAGGLAAEGRSVFSGDKRSLPLDSGNVERGPSA